MRVVKRSAMAAGLLLVAGTVLMWLVLFRSTGVAFADVVAMVKTAHAMRCRMVVEIDVAGAGKQTTEVEALHVAPGWTIVTSPGMKMIVSAQDGRTVTLTQATKQAMVMDIKNRPAAPQTVNLLDIFKNVDGKAGQPLGEREIDGKQTRGFQVTNGGMDMKVWADVKTDFPVLVEMTPTSPFMPAGTYTMKDFDWNPTYDASELSVEVPAGYAIASTAVDASKTSEQDVLIMLKAMADTNDGQFPDGVGLEGFTKLLGAKMANRAVVETAGMTAAQRSQWQQKMTADMMKTMAPITRGWMFMSDATQSDNWYFGGAGVKLGDKGHAVLWYQTKPAGTWRVFDADLTVHEVKEADLPKGEPVKGVMQLHTGSPAATTPARTLP